MNFPEDGFDDNSLLEEVMPLYEGNDPAHDFSHALRVCRNARLIGEEEGADLRVALLAALLHDAGSGPKLPKRRADAEAGKLAALEDLLKRRDMPEDVRGRVLRAVETHSFSKGMNPETMEEMVLQDADRLDAIGAIGIARVFLTGGALGRPLYNPEDPFCRKREPDDGRWNLDHFYRKLLKLEDGMHTEAGRRLARRRGAVLRRYLMDLEDEISKGI
ncbi:HD domain-containing protein [Methanocrinis sp.]|uniref:HD domain-containing protein n=1 Tax=Methanocrinis sp. TaxID=3101522 RepID=UPI003D0D7DAC